MFVSISRRRFIALGILGGLGLTGIGCGTIMHPERKGQPAGDLDWSIVALNGVGLLLFLIPGVIAFAVDFNNGTIYLPQDSNSHAARNPGDANRQLIPVETHSKRLTPAAVENVVCQRVGRPVRLIRGKYETHELQTLDQFWHRLNQLNRA